MFRLRKNETGPRFYPEFENISDKDRFTGFDYIWENNHETFWNNITENYYSVNAPKCTDELAKDNSIQGGKSNGYNDSEKLSSGLSSKLDHQALEEYCDPKLYPVKEDKSPEFTELPISDESPISNDTPNSASIQKYQFALERNLRGFIPQPENMTISVNEFSTELKVEKFASKEERLTINPREQIIGETEKLQKVFEPEPESNIMQKSESKSQLGIETKSQPDTKVHMALEHESSPELKPECEPSQAVKHALESKSKPKLEHVSEHELEHETEPVPEEPKQDKEHEREHEHELEHETELDPEEPKQDEEHECEHEHELEPEPDLELEHELRPEPLDGVRCDTEAKSENDFSDGSDRESWSERKLENTYYEKTKKPSYLAIDILSSIDDVRTESVTKTSERCFFNPMNEPTEFENVLSDPEKPLEIPKRSINKPTSVPNRRKLGRKRRSIKKEMLSEKPKLSSSSSSPSTVSSTEKGRWTPSGRHASEDFSGFDSDSQSSVSDGYSVKDLVVDSDNDWFLSEKEPDNSPHKTYSTEESTNLLRYTSKLMDHLKGLEKSQAQSFYGSETDSRNSAVQISYNHHQPDEVNELLENNYKPEFDVLNHEESERVKFKEIVGLNETHIENNRLFARLVTKEDLSKETQISISSQEDEAMSGFLDGENHMEASNEYGTISPRKDFVTEKPTQDTEKIDSHQSKSTDKGKELLDEEEEDELESLWEHQDLIEQLKMEIKKARAIGLPTILEESETPKTTIEEFKAWHFDEKFLREDPMDELNKFYKSYRERMRKFDILNYQKMYAVGMCI
jgi:hypothetical protein